MRYYFPFQLVPKGSRIILFGTGDVGKDFYLQIHELEDYYTLVAWTSTRLDAYELRPPFDYAKNIPNYEFDYIVVAAAGEEPIREIKEYCADLGVTEEKIVAPGRFYYERGAGALPRNKAQMFKNMDFFTELYDLRLRSNLLFQAHSYYQSFAELGLAGARNSNDRIALYQIRELLSREDTVADLGCDIGFFALQVAPFVKHIDGYDVDPSYIAIANRTKEFLGRDNAEFFCKNLFAEPCLKTYGAVFSFAIYKWVILAGVSEKDFIDKIYDMLDPNGYLFFESHLNDGELFLKLCTMFEQKGMERIFHKMYTDDEREMTVFRKRGERA